MTHGLCGKDDPQAPSMVRKLPSSLLACKKRFPIPFSATIVVHKDVYPKYWGTTYSYTHFYQYTHKFYFEYTHNILLDIHTILLDIHTVLLDIHTILLRIYTQFLLQLRLYLGQGNRCLLLGVSLRIQRYYNCILFFLLQLVLLLEQRLANLKAFPDLPLLLVTVL